MNSLPVITIFVRHSANCPYKEDPTYKRCSCKKHLRWFQNGKQHVKPTKQRTWAAAEDARRQLEKIWTANEQGEGLRPDAKQETITDKVKSFLEKKRSENLSPATIRKYEQQLPLFDNFLAVRNKFTPNSVTPTDVVEFRSSWKWADLTKIKAQQNLKSFIRFAFSKHNRQDLLDVLGDIKQTEAGIERRKPKPLSDDERRQLLNQVPITFADEQHKIPKIQMFIKAATSLGLSSIDMVKLRRRDVERAKNGILEIKRQKTKRPARPRMDPKLRAELLALANGNPEFIFWGGDTLTESATGWWQADLRRLFDDAGLWIKGNLSHRFRDTAVDRWLGQGASMTDVAAMLGDTLAVTEKHYADLASDRMIERLAKVPALSGD